MGLSWLMFWLAMWVLLTGSPLGPNRRSPSPQWPAGIRFLLLLFYIGSTAGLTLFSTISTLDLVRGLGKEPEPVAPLNASSAMDKAMAAALARMDMGYCYEAAGCEDEAMDMKTTSPTCAKIGGQAWQPDEGDCVELDSVETEPAETDLHSPVVGAPL